MNEYEQGDDNGSSGSLLESSVFESDDNLLFMGSSMDSLPLLASPEFQSDDWTSNGGSSGIDSGVIEEAGGGVSNLCRRRPSQVVGTGLVTETGPVIPVTLGFSLENEEGEWEEIFDDENRVVSGVERVSFRLNIIDGNVESLDESLNEDGSDAYQADNSESECENENMFGCSRATLKSLTDEQGETGNMCGCSRATLKSLSDTQGELDKMLGCSRATLKPLSDAQGETEMMPGCSRATLKSPADAQGESEQEVVEWPLLFMLCALMYTVMVTVSGFWGASGAEQGGGTCPAQDANNVHFDELFVLENSGLGGDERVREEEELAGSRIHEYRSSEQVNLSAEDDGTLTLRYARPAQNGDTS